MDGNRRWAKANGKPAFGGHYRGYEKLIDCVDWFFSRGVKFLSVFAFSTENWNRSNEEVSYLMNLLKKAIDDQTKVAVNCPVNCHKRVSRQWKKQKPAKTAL